MIFIEKTNAWLHPAATGSTIRIDFGLTLIGYRNINWLHRNKTQKMAKQKSK